MKTSTVDAAKGRWHGILLALGVDEKYLRDKQGPCPACGGKTRFRWDNKDGGGTFFCNSCGAGDGFQLLERVHGWNFSRAAREVDGVVGNVAEREPSKHEMTDEQKAASNSRMLKGAQPLEYGTPSWNYLIRRCGDLSHVRLKDLRHHPALKHSIDGGVHPAMLAVLRYSDRKGCSVHRTYLTPGGHKADVSPVRMTCPGLPLAGASVHLGPPSEIMGVAEGIETAISAAKVYGMPVWAAISAGGVQSWVPPAEAKTVWVFSDNDLNCVGQLAAFNLAKRLRGEGLDVEVQIPPTVGTDWNDVFWRNAELGVKY